MFQLAISIRLRMLVVIGLAGLGLAAAVAGGVAWYLLRCDVQDYFYRMAAAPFNLQEKYLYACGYVWRSTDGGSRWTRLASSGLPIWARHGFIAVDREPRTLYLGVLIPTSSSAYCWNCAWTYLRPAIYTSQDGGLTWAYAYRFKRGPAGENDFLGLYSDPDREGMVWAVIKNADEIVYYGSGSNGHFWKRTCHEYNFVGSGGCKLPKGVMEFAFPDVTADNAGGP